MCVCVCVCVDIHIHTHTECTCHSSPLLSVQRGHDSQAAEPEWIMMSLTSLNNVNKYHSCAPACMADARILVPEHLLRQPTQAGRGYICAVW